MELPAGAGTDFINHNGVNSLNENQCFKIPGYFKIVSLMN